MLKRKTWMLVLAVQFMLSIVLVSSTVAITPSPAVQIARVTGETPSGETLPNPNQTHINYKV
jgi:hypothetical protein